MSEIAKPLPVGAVEFERDRKWISATHESAGHFADESLQAELAEKIKTIDILTAKFADAEQRFIIEHGRAESLAMWQTTVLRACGVPDEK